MVLLLIDSVASGGRSSNNRRWGTECRSAGRGGFTGVRHGIVAERAAELPRGDAGCWRCLGGNNHRTFTEVEGSGRRGNRGMPSASGSIAGGATASRMAQRWGVRMDSHQHTNLFTGQATLEATISRRRHGCAIRVLSMAPASAWNVPCPCKIMQRAGTAATRRFRRDWVAPGRLVKFQKRGEICLA